MLKKVHNESVVQQIINSLTDAMMRRELKPGDRIPTETQLAETFGVGRNSVREAIKILVYMGVLEIRRADGTFVCEGFSESMIDPMIYGIILDKAESYESLMELRELMEVGVLQLAIQKVKTENLNELWSTLEQMRLEIENEVCDVDRIFRIDNLFHEKISDMGQNSLVKKINQVVHVLTHSLRYHTVQTMLDSGRGKELYEAHLNIYNILAQKNTDYINEAVRKTYFSDITFLPRN